MWNNIDQDRHYLGQFQIEDETIPGEILYNKKSGIIMLLMFVIYYIYVLLGGLI